MTSVQRGTMCRECPFKRTSLPGYLGAEEDPWHFVMNVHHDNPLPCHMTIDYENDPDWQEHFAEGEGHRCEGAMVYAANTCKMPRDPAEPRRAANREQVFASPSEFMLHHHKDRSTP